MIPLSLADIAQITGARLDLVPDPGVTVTGPVIIDSRSASPGALFAALPGERVDGHDFASAAVAAGAAAVLASRPAGVPALIVPDVPAAMAMLARAVVDRLPGLTIAGITGSAGKTTTKDLAAQLVERLGPTVAPHGSYNNEIGHPLTVLRATAATRYLVLELSARGAGHIARQCEIAPPSFGVVLCVGHAHAGEFGGLAEVARAKGELPAALPPDGVALLNADDPRVLAMAGRTAARVVTFGRAAQAAVRAEQVRLDDLGRPAFTLVTPAGSAPVRLRLHGEHNVVNALAAAALAGELGLDVPAVADGLSAATARSKWRMEVTVRPDGVTVINDAYNASPEAMAAAIGTLAAMARGRRAFAVLGPMYELGGESRACHEEAGGLAARAGVAGLIVVGEDAAPILTGAKAQHSWHGEMLAVPDPAAAVEALGARLAPGDVVLVKASRAAGLERVALALTGEAQAEEARAGQARAGEAGQ
ncbi:MAG TPA: UDP-N-acetylmuramoyl-tripeptide--D-alanyl-D-alanine ligase [Streptosporangiaceae bacterium]|nr:UDP-N-acetylmuramoyl-tripeptide--D-alanyl-D-alanine ligase [Streptosporangiaceae bacterium]